MWEIMNCDAELRRDRCERAGQGWSRAKSRMICHDVLGRAGYADTSSRGRVRFVISLTSNDDEMRFRLLRAIESGL